MRCPCSRACGLQPIAGGPHPGSVEVQELQGRGAEGRQDRDRIRARNGSSLPLQKCLASITRLRAQSRERLIKTEVPWGAANFRNRLLLVQSGIHALQDYV